jgi:hypothetical protein
MLISVRGHGKVSAVAGTEDDVFLNGNRIASGTMRWGAKRREVFVPKPAPLEIEAPTVSSDVTEAYRALVGFRPSPAAPPWSPVVVSWRTSVPSDSAVEYTENGRENWVRTLKPDTVTDHRIVLSRLTSGSTYRLRLRSSTDDGRVATRELEYRYSDSVP